MKKFPVYLFDLDGTLIDTMDLIVECFRYLFENQNVHVPEKNQILSQVGIPLKTQFKRFFPEKNDAGLELLLDIYMDHQYKNYKKYLKAFPGVRESLDYLKRIDSHLALVTSRRKKSAEIFTHELGLFDFFDVIITPEDTERHKPDPEPALLALTRLGIQGKNGLFVGDADFDMSCGKAAGIETAFVLWGPTDPSTLSVTPDYMLKSIRELCD